VTFRRLAAIEARPAPSNGGGPDAARSIVVHKAVVVVTSRPTEFVDVTDVVSQAVRDAGLADGIVTVQTRHTTTGLLINEHEPLLLGDLQALFERLVPAETRYAHDDLGRRTVNVAPGERHNGHAHCRAALLRTSEWLSVQNGVLSLGRWQRMFLVEFDGGQRREIAITMSGLAGH
jgi:secondary thiamine-phosphate synthase enzyme